MWMYQIPSASWLVLCLTPGFQPRSHSSPLSDGFPTSASSWPTSGSHSQNSTRSTSQLLPPNKSENFRFLTINCNSIKSKKGVIENVAAYTSPDVIFLNETKLDQDVKSAELTPAGYKCFRMDRDLHGGGVAIMVKQCLTASEIPMKEVIGEVCSVKIDTNDNPLYVGSFYRTLSDKSEHQLLELEKSLIHIKTLTRNNPNSTVVVSGDFNARYIDWENVSVPTGARDRNICSKLLEILIFFNLEQQQMSPSQEFLIYFAQINLASPSLYTPYQGYLTMRLCMQTATSEPVSVKKTSRRVHMWSRADWPSLKAKLQAFQAEFLATHTARTVEENYNALKGKVQSLINSHILIKMTSSRANMPWFNNTLKRMCKEKQKLFNKAKSSGTNKWWQQYRTYKRDTLKAIRRQRAGNI